MTTRKNLFAALDVMAAEITTSKTAAAKQAGSTPADPGGYMGKSTHPTADADNNVEDASEGARSSENSTDVKADIGTPSVDSTSESGGGDQDSVQLNIGTEQAATGEDPSAEDDYKEKKDDPGTTSQMDADKDREKYSAATIKSASAKAAVLANDILTEIVAGRSVKSAGVALPPPGPMKPKAAAPAAKPAAAPGAAPAGGMTAKLAAAQAALNDPAKAFDAGYELAAELGFDKAAAHANVQQCIERTIKDAHLQATLVGNYLLAKQAAFAKQSEGAPPPVDPAAGGDPAAMGGGGDPAAMMGGAPPMDPAAGGADPMAGGDPAAMGGDPAAGGGAPSDDEALQELAAALQEMGISPDELIQMLQGAGGGAGGAAPPGGGAPPEGGAPADPMAEGMKMARAVKDFQRSGRFRIKEAKTKRAQDLRNLMKGHINELLSSIGK